MKAHVGALSLLAAALLPVTGAVAVRGPATGLVFLAGELVGLGWLVTDVRSAARRLPAGAVAAGSIGLTTWLYGGHDLGTASGAGLRVLCVVVPAALVTPSIRPSELGDQLGQRLRLPARHVVAAMTALQRVEELGEQWQQVRRARRARGLSRRGGPVHTVREAWQAAFALLVVALRQSTATAVAMDARGFAGASRRTWACPATWSSGDSLVLGVAAGLAALPWLAAGWLG